MEVVDTLFQQVLLFLLSLISDESFPLGALALLPPLQRRRVLVFLPLVDLHGLPPSVTVGIDMDKFWKEVFTERLCEETKQLTKPTKLELVIESRDSRILMDCPSSEYSSSILSKDCVHRLLFAVPFKEDLSVRRKSGFQRIEDTGYTKWCKGCKNYKFYCLPKCVSLFMSCCEVEVHPLVTLTSSFLMAVTVLLDIFPLEIDTLTLCMDNMTEIPSTIMEAPFCRIVHHVCTLKIKHF